MMPRGFVRAAMLGALLTGCAAEESELAELRIGLSGGSSSTGGASFGDSGGAGTTGTGGGSSSTGEPECVEPEPPPCPTCGFGGCPQPGVQIPDECDMLFDTPPNAGQWLWCHEHGPEGPGGLLCEVFIPDDLTDDLIDTIADACDDLPTIEEQIHCAATLVDAALGGIGETECGPVCRHHAAALDNVLEAMGIDIDWGTNPSHAWNRVPIDDNDDGIPDRHIYVDSYNGIMFECPASVVPD